MKGVFLFAVFAALTYSAFGQNNNPPVSTPVTGFSPAPVAGFNAVPVSGLAPQPVTGYSFAPQASPAPAAPANFTQNIVPSLTTNAVSGFSDTPVSNLDPNPAPVLPQGDVIAEQVIVDGLNAAPVSGFTTNLPSVSSTNLPSPF